MRKNRSSSKKILALSEQLRVLHPDKRALLCFQDEARFGLKSTYRRVRSKKGKRPHAPSKTRSQWT